MLIFSTISKQVQRGLLGIILLFFSSTLAYTDSRDRDQAKDVAIGWMRLNPHPMNKRINQEIKSVDSCLDINGDIIFYVVHLKPEGFIVISPDDFIEPIIAFSTDGLFLSNSKNPLFDILIKEMPHRLKEAKGMGPENEWKLKEKQEKWNKYRLMKRFGPGTITGQTFTSSSSPSDVRVEPLLGSTWGQSTVFSNNTYNYYTPNNYVCGCVATAMAQLMRFHQYPSSAIGVSSFGCYVDGSGRTLNTRGGNGTGGAYNFSLMPLSPGSSISATERSMIGSLCYDAGVSVGMSYTLNSSGAYTSKVDIALMGVFKYTNAMYAGYYGSGAGIAPYMSTMANPNLDAGLPVLVEILGSTADHEVVCDGYGYDAGMPYYHLNMGWDGSNNAWYNLPVFSAGYSWTNVPACIYNVYPGGGTGEIISGRVVDASGTPLAGVNVSITGPINRTVTTNAKGIYAFPRVNYGHYSVVASKNGYIFPTKTADPIPSVRTNSYGGNAWGIDFTSAARNITITPSITTLPSGGTQQFTAIVNGVGSNNVTWSASSGSIDSSGFYTATNSPGSCIITAKSALDSSVNGFANVTILNNTGPYLEYFGTVSYSNGMCDDAMASGTCTFEGYEQIYFKGTFDNAILKDPSGTVVGVYTPSNAFNGLLGSSSNCSGYAQMTNAYMGPIVYDYYGGTDTGFCSVSPATLVDGPRGAWSLILTKDSIQSTYIFTF